LVNRTVTVQQFMYMKAKKEVVSLSYQVNQLVLLMLMVLLTPLVTMITVVTGALQIVQEINLITAQLLLKLILVAHRLMTHKPFQMYAVHPVAAAPHQLEE